MSTLVPVNNGRARTSDDLGPFLLRVSCESLVHKVSPSREPESLIHTVDAVLCSVTNGTRLYSLQNFLQSPCRFPRFRGCPKSWSQGQSSARDEVGLEDVSVGIIENGGKRASIFRVSHDDFCRVTARGEGCKIVREIDLCYSLSDVGDSDLVVGKQRILE